MYQLYLNELKKLTTAFGMYYALPRKILIPFHILFTLIIYQ